MIFLTDRSYQQNVTTLEKIREEWQKEHIKACEVNALKHLHVAASSLDVHSLMWRLGTAFPSLYSPGFPDLLFYFLSSLFITDRVRAPSSDVFPHYLPVRPEWLLSKTVMVMVTSAHLVT